MYEYFTASSSLSFRYNSILDGKGRLISKLGFIFCILTTLQPKPLKPTELEEVAYKEM